jgi:hypothetical protein
MDKVWVDMCGPILVITGLSLGIVVYFIPSITAGKRKHPQYASIFIVNLLLGWTFIGWVIALVWSASATSRDGSDVATEDPPALVIAPSVSKCPMCFRAVPAGARACLGCGNQLSTAGVKKSSSTCSSCGLPIFTDGDCVYCSKIAKIR